MERLTEQMYDDEDEVWDALKNHAKQVHSERVAKNPDRIAYAIQQFEAHGIEYQLKNEQTGHFHCWRKSDDKLFQFYAGTGKIQGFTQVRGIHSLIQMLEGWRPMEMRKHMECASDRTVKETDKEVR